MEKYQYCVNIANELQIELDAEAYNTARKTVKHLINQLNALKSEIKQKKPKTKRAGLV